MQDFPVFALPPFDLHLWNQLITPALLIAVVGYVASISVAQTLASKKRQHVDPNQELIALGASNFGASLSGGFPVAGGFSRSIVNFEAGAETPAAGAFTAVGIALVALFLTPLLYFLPSATLGATIFVAVLSMVNFKAVKLTYAYSPSDGIAMALTIILTFIIRSYCRTYGRHWHFADDVPVPYLKTPHGNRWTGSGNTITSKMLTVTKL